MKTRNSTLILLGPEGSFSSIAAKKLRGAYKLQYVSSFKKLFSIMPSRSEAKPASARREREASGSAGAELKKLMRPKGATTVSGATYGLAPVRNKIIGKLPEISRLLKKHRCKILRRFRMPISFVIAAKQKIKLADISKVFISRPAYEQCKNFLRTCLPQVRINKNLLSTSYAFKKVVQHKGRNAAAIGNAYATKLYKLKILARNVQDSAKNWTEFILFTFTARHK